MEAGGGPFAVESGEDHEDSVSHGVGEVVGVFGEEGSLGMESTCGPWGSLLDEVEEGGEPLEGKVGKKCEVGGGGESSRPAALLVA